MENGTIIQQLRSGHNEAALRELYKGFPAVSHFIRKHGGNQDDARDMFQESLLIFYRNVQKKEFELTSSVNTYLFSVAKYLWKDELKKKNRTVPLEMQLQETPAHLPYTGQEERKIGLMDKVLSQLGEKCSEILRLFYYEKKAMEEIASRLQYKNVDTAKTQKYKCMERAKLMAGELMLSSLTEEL